MSEEKVKPVCGLVMPISSMDSCSESHWSDVRDILTEAIEAAGFTGNLVSDADEVGIIHKRIIQNLYDNPMVVCDVSGKNPNVMFELGIRLAFDKPTVIVKDDKTSYSFDTSAIEHLEYPRDLRFTTVVAFKKKLAEKIAATHLRAISDENFTTFLKHFGEFTVAKLDQKEVSGQEYILEELKTIKNSVRRLESNPYKSNLLTQLHRTERPAVDIDICFYDLSPQRIEANAMKAREHPQVQNVRIQEVDGHYHLLADVKPGVDAFEVSKLLERMAKPRFQQHKASE